VILENFLFKTTAEMFKLHFKKPSVAEKTYNVTDSMLGDAKNLCLTKGRKIKMASA
jgi:hypothetical protein